MTLSWQSNLPSFSLNGLTTEEVRNKVDEEISQMHKRIIMLKTFRNSLASISQLPTELLSKIFRHLRSGRLSQKSDDKAETPFILTWVCRQWREIALASPRLWSIITNGTDKQIEVSLQRSRKFSLSVNLSDPSATAFISCLRQIARIRDLKLVRSEVKVGRPYMQGPKVRDLLLQPAPQLTSLHFEGVIVPSPELVLFSGVLPNLDSVRLHGCRLQLSSMRAKSLLSGPTITYLYISGHDRRIEAGPFAEVLTSLPNLRKLELSFSLTRDGISRTIPRISLPNLQTIKITDSPTAIFKFLDWFDIPACSINLSFPLEVYFYETESIGTTFQQYREAISFDFSHFEYKSHAEAPDHLTLNFSDNPSSYRYSLELYIVDEERAHVLDGLDFSQVTHLRLSIFGDPFDDIEPLIQLHNVEVLSASGNATGLGEIVELLFPFPDADFNNKDDLLYEVVSFAKLKVLTFDELNDDAFYLLVEALAARRAVGLPRVEWSIKG